MFSDGGKGAKLSHLTYDSSDEEASEKKVRGMSVPPLIPVVSSQSPSTRLPPPRETWGSPPSPSVSHDSCFEEQPPPLRSEGEDTNNNNGGGGGGATTAKTEKK